MAVRLLKEKPYFVDRLGKRCGAESEIQTHVPGGGIQNRPCVRPPHAVGDHYTVTMAGTDEERWWAWV